MASDLRHPRYMGVGLQTVHQESRDDEGKEGSPPWTPAGKELTLLSTRPVPSFTCRQYRQTLQGEQAPIL